MRKIKFSLIWTLFPKLLSFLPKTLAVLFFSLFFALIIGSLLYIVRRKHIPIVSQIIRVWMSYIRGTPPITQLFLIYFGLPVLLKPLGLDIARIPGIYYAILTYSVSFGAAVSENIRASVASVGSGQFQAAYSMGMTEFTAFRRIIFPQMIVVALPNFGNIVIGALKNTSLVFSVGVVEMMSACNIYGSQTLHYMEAYITVAVIYYLLYLILTRCLQLIERNVSKHIRT